MSELNLKQTELIFAATVAATRSELISRLDSAEHAATWSIPATATDVKAVLQNPDALLTPIAVSALLLWGRVKFGDAWFAPPI